MKKSKHIKGNRRNYFPLVFFLLFPIFGIFSQVLIQEDFTNYDGTSSTLPSGWYFSTHDNYTSTSYSGNSGPNSYKFSSNGSTVVTPQFANADSVYFWIKGAGIDSLSTFIILETSDSIVWDTIAKLNSINTTSPSGNTWGFTVNSNAKYLKFIYTKSTGNLAFDDFKIVHSQYQNSTISPADTAIAGGKIKIYFNHPVDTSVSTGFNALNIGNKMLDTIVAYINRAKYSIDISEYNYLYPSLEKIANAVNNAYSRGVDIRWIYDKSAPNNGLSYLNSNIHTLGRTQPSGLMHNKYVVVDAKNTADIEPIVITGSINWGWMHFDNDFNNLVIIQDSLLADAYTKEFNQMWGGSGLIPNLSLSKFGSSKTTVMSNSNFDIGGVHVELYFSPANPTNQNIINSINSADTDIYFGVFSFTRQDIANAIKSKINAGIFSAGIMGDGSLSYNAYATLSPVMNNLLQINYGYPIYHNKLGIIDPSDSLSDPQVITGSHNWSTSAETKNDENTVIIHSAIAANMYYQSFHHDFNHLGGTLNNTELKQQYLNVNFYPVPFKKECTLQFNVNHSSQLTITAYNLNSQETILIANNTLFEKGIHHLKFAPKSKGMYVITIREGKQINSYKVIKIED